MLIVHASFPVAPDERERALELARELAAASREEAGVLEYRVTTDADDENVLRFLERYEDEAALGAHAESDHFAEFEAELPDLLAGQPQATRFDVASSEELEL